MGRHPAAGQNNHLHVMDDRQRVALVRTGAAHPDHRGPATAFQLGDHLGSSIAVLDDAGTLTNREEFTPYGETSFGSFARKRCRFTGKERDEESGLSDYGARYYASWLARWSSTDPLAQQDGKLDPVAGRSPNLFIYCNDSPIETVDPDGRDAYVLANVGGREIDYAAVATREREIWKRITATGRSGKDYVYVLEAFDLGQLGSQIDQVTADAKAKGFGKTVEFSLWSHGGDDGPNARDLTTGPDYLDKGEGRKQMHMAGWAKIDFNFDPKHSIAAFYGCKGLDFAKRFISLQPNLQFAAGFDVSSYPSWRADKSDWHCLDTYDDTVDKRLMMARKTTHYRYWDKVDVYFVGESMWERATLFSDEITYMKVIDRAGKQRKAMSNVDIDLLNRGPFLSWMREPDRP